MDSKINILAIDDDKISQKMIGRALQNEPVSIDFADDGEQGLDKAQYKLGLFYLKGIGTDEDANKAMDWLQKSAEQGYPPAQFRLGKLYAGATGGGNYKRALDWLQKAQDNGYQPATIELIRLKRK